MNSPRPVALITGGAKRVGAEIARCLASHGFDVCITYFQSKRQADELVNELNRTGAKAIGVPADLTNPATSATALKDQFSQTFPRTDLLVNNASMFEPGDLASVDVAQIRRYQSLHVEAPVLLAKIFADDLRRSRGTLINMVDLLAEKPFPKYLAYCASKAALANLTLSLARELAPEVNVNAIAPGVVDWPDDYTPPMREQYLRRVPLGRAGTPADVARLIHFLATAGKYITGQIIRLDGGRSLT